MTWRSSAVALLLLVAACLAPRAVAHQSSDAAFFSDMRWRLVGPHRAGRVSTVAGVSGNHAVYYIGTPAGGVWKTTSGGTTWTPISSGIPVTSIGAVAVAPSNPSIVYVGTGHNLIGAGMFKSTDAGATWQHAGLDDTKYITGLLIDSRDPNTVLAGVGSGGNFGSMVFYNNNPSAARGVYRTSDGGRTWAHTLFVDDQSGLVDLVSDPAEPRVVFASLTAGQRAAATGPPVYRSDDSGATWARLAAEGLPPTAGSATIAVAPGTGDRRVYALASGRGGGAGAGGAGGVFRSDDGGASFTLMTSRIASASGHLYVDPKNPDVLYTMGTSMYRSIDGGRTLESYKGAPGGDDNRSLWIDPQDGQRMIIGADQGPTITVDGGRTWTPWYTVPNGEHYYVTTDNQFPYWIYAAQQDSGTVAIRSRGDFGAIRPSDWYPVSGYEQGHIFADPLNSRYVYSHGNGHAIIRFDRETGQSGPVYTPSDQDRFGPRPGMEISPKDPHVIFVGAQHVLQSIDRVTWTQISPDLTVPADAPAPAAAAGGRGAGRGGAGGGGRGGGVGGGGTIVALAPSALDVNLLWAGTSNGLLQLTRDGGAHWTNVSPPRLTSETTLTLWSLEASSHDAGVAYAAAIDLSDHHGPCIFRTEDFGATWQTIVQGLPDTVPTRVVREDPRQANLLYAGTQGGIFVSFDRGDRWQPLQLNLPPSPINDIAIHDTDLVVATWGRAIWILDDVTPLRQIEAVRSSIDPAFLFVPAPAVRVRWDNNQDTPLPPEVPQGQNPPDGAIIDYDMRAAASGPVTLRIDDAQGGLVREYTSGAPPSDTTMPNVPMYWFKQPDVLATTAGMHRFVWDLRYPTPPSLNYGADGNPASTASYGIIAPAIIGQSPRQQPVGSLVAPGTYRATLTVNGRTYTRQITVTNDPRSQIAPQDIETELRWERGLAAGIAKAHAAIESVREMRRGVAAAAQGSSQPAFTTAAQAFDRAALATINALAGARALTQHLGALEYADLKPTASTVAALQRSCSGADDGLARFRQFVEQDLPIMNAALKAAGLAAAPLLDSYSQACGPVAVR
jgi:photosystem II stability/assembly factor-like uncharacterized protein